MAKWMALALAIAVGWLAWASRPAGPETSFGAADLVYGRRGLMPGEFQKPRALAIDAADRVYTIDMKAEINVFDADGALLTSWKTPTHEFGRPSGLACFGEQLVVADSHYRRLLVYTPEGKLLRTLGGDDAEGPLKGYFCYLADVAVDDLGNFYVAESNERERITKLSPDGAVLASWGERGPAPGQFSRVRAMAFGPGRELFVADAFNHRVQVFNANGKFLRIVGAGLLHYPYDLAVAADGTLYVAEWAQGRVRRFNAAGQPTGAWGSLGSGPNQLHQPWALGLDSRGRLHVADSLNHRVQRVVP